MIPAMYPLKMMTKHCVMAGYSLLIASGTCGGDIVVIGGTAVEFKSAGITLDKLSLAIAAEVDTKSMLVEKCHRLLILRLTTRRILLQ